MSRFRLYLQGMVSNYVALAATVAYSLVSVPLALSYLSKQQFALWALLSQFVSYLWLIDFGMSPSVGRLLIEHKDQPNAGAYGGLIQTGIWVTIAQGAVVLVTGLALPPFLSFLFKIPADLQATFCALIRWQSVITACTFCTRMFRNMLYAHQRNDLINYSQAASLLVGLACLWLMLRSQAGVSSVIWANGSALVFLVLATGWHCLRLRLFPARGCWGRSSWREFKGMFGYGKDVFVVQVGGLLIMGVQSIIVSRSLGLEAVATWSVGTRAFFLLFSMIYQVFDVSAPALSEMMVRGEHERLRRRFKGIVIVSEVLAGVAAVIYAGCNSTFVSVWTHGRISWSVWSDVLLGAWMIVAVLVHANAGFVVLTKRIAGLRYIYLVEGAVFVGLASLVTPVGGISAMIGCSVVCSCCFSGFYAIRRVNEYFRFARLELERFWLGSLGRILVLLLPIALATWWVAGRLCPVNRLLVSATVNGAVGGLLFLRLGIPSDLQEETLNRVPPAIRPWLEKFVRRRERPA